MPKLEEVAVVTGAHNDAELRQTVVRGFVRDNADWRPAIEDALRAVWSADPLNPEDLARAAQAVDMAMMRGIHAAVKEDAIRDLGVVSFDSTDPAERERWEREGAPAAAARAAGFNAETAALERRED